MSDVPPKGVFIISDDEDEDDGVLFKDHFAVLATTCGLCWQKPGAHGKACHGLEVRLRLLDTGRQRQSFAELGKAKPFFAMLSPPCTMYGNLQRCLKNFDRMKNKDTRMAQADCLLKFASVLAMKHMNAGRYYALEHPETASSWQQPCIQELSPNRPAHFVAFDQCRLGLQCPETKQPIKKRTVLVSNSPAIRLLRSSSAIAQFPIGT